MLVPIPLQTEEQLLVPLAIVLLVEYILAVTILFALQRNNTIYRGFNEGKNFNNYLSGHGGFGGSIVLLVLRYLFLILFLCVIAYNFFYQPHKMGLKHEEWALYSQWSLLLVTFYFLMATTLSARKLYKNKAYSENLPLIDPRLTKFVSSLFSLAGVVALVSSTVSIYDNGKNVIVIDHIVLASMIMEVFLNNFSVTASDIFLSFMFSYVYISVMFICVVLFDAVKWPHMFLVLKDRWCLARYNIFIFVHVLQFTVFYLLVNKVSCGTARELPKIAPKLEDEARRSPRDNQVEPFWGNDDDSGGGDKRQPNKEDARDDGDDHEHDGDIENQKSERKRRLSDPMDEELESLYGAEHRSSRREAPAAGDLNAEEEKELKHDVGKLSHRLHKQQEKYEKLKHKNEENDIKIAQLEADIDAKKSQIDMLVSQQREVLERRIEAPVELVPAKPKRNKVAKRYSTGDGLHVADVVNCPGCEKDYRIDDDLKLVEVGSAEDVNAAEEDDEETKVMEPFITDQIDKDYFRHVLLAESTKDSRKRAKKLGIDIYYNKDVEDGKDKSVKPKKDLQNEIYQVCTGDLLYPARDPETLKEEKKQRLLDAKQSTVTDFDDNNDIFSSRRRAVSPGGPGELEDLEEVKKPKKILFYRQKTELRDALKNESVDEIRDRAEELGIDIYDEYGMLKLKKNLKAEIYGEMTGDSIYEDVHAMSRLDSRVLVSK